MEGVGSGEGPGPDLELSVAVTAGGDDGAVAAEPHSMGRSRRDGYDVAPSAHLALTGFRAAGGDDGAISPTLWRLPAATAVISVQHSLPIQNSARPTA